MACGYQNSSGADLDAVFDPYVEGGKPAATGYRTSDGVDLNQRYAPLSYGSAAAATGLQLASGADLNTLWAAKGTASYYTPMRDATLSRSSSSKKGAGAGNTTLTSDTFTAGVSGGEAPYTYTWTRVSGTVLTVLNQGSASTRFRRSAAAVSTTSVYRCVIKDNTGRTLSTGNLTIAFTHYQVFPDVFVDQQISGNNAAFIHIEVRRDGVVRRILERGNVTVLGDWVAPKSDTVGDQFRIRFDDDDTIPDDDDDLNTYATTPAPGTWGAINTDRIAAHAGSPNGLQPHVAGVRLRLQLNGSDTDAMDKSFALIVYSYY